MAVKALLVILTVLSGCNLCYSQSTNVWTYSTNDSLNYFNLEWQDLKNNSMKIYFRDDTLHIENSTRGEGPLVIDLTTFPKQNISQDLRDNHNIQELRQIVIASVALSDGSISFGTLFEHFGIEHEILSFEGYVVSSPTSTPSFSLDDCLSKGFVKVKNLKLRWNNITRLNEKVFQSMLEISNLNVGRNEIEYLHPNVFQNVTKLTDLDLSSNKLKSLSVGMFDHQTNLNFLNLDGNRLNNLTKGMFRGLSSLRSLVLSNNNFTGLIDDVFHHLTNLQFIYLGNSNLVNIVEMPNAIFASHSQLKIITLERVNISSGLQLSGLEVLAIHWSTVMMTSGLSNIKEVFISDNVLYPLDVSSFKNLSSTRELALSSNGIINLADGLFDELTKLESLYLSNNQLTNISGLVFRELENLIEIDLSNNHLTAIHPNAFNNNKRLTNIYLENNRLTFKDDRAPFMHVHKLIFLDLSNNSLTRMPTELMKLNELKVVNLANNQISSVTFSELRHNFIRPTFETDGVSIGIYLNGNPLKCDCSMFVFLLYTYQGELAKVFSHNCVKRPYYPAPCYHEPHYPGCPSECVCEAIEYEPFLHVVISCGGKHLAKLPRIEFMNDTSIDLYISNNNFQELPLVGPNLRVTFIQASFNQISKIEKDRIPSTLRGLDLRHNEIRTISANVIRYLINHKSLEIFFFKENPLECHCWSDDTEQLIKFAYENSSMTDLKDAKCDVHHQLSMEVIRKKCTNDVITTSLIIVTILSIISVAIVLLFIKYHQFIKMWLYAHDWFLWWVDEEYVDRDKVYDVFISYANENQMLANRIMYALEKCDIFKVCLHERDFIVGEGIEKSVQNAVRNSRRTLVILSESYMQSVWCEHEFHLAWERSVAEKRKLIIAVKDGNLGEITDETIQSYIKTHTYIESVDEWFWEKLIFRLPHKSTNKDIFPIREWDVIPLGANESSL